ncbi:PIN domain-containing protein [Kineococcus sp. SYSU DK018]|uniref:PIN domain-containing protein n=1 Tax=Kineococcus sp. SYSU DK018 TaxID=3383139 RepID=UPI003D7D6D35
MSFLLDESAHARWHQPVVAARLNELLRADLLAIARPSVLEIGLSARSPQDHRDVIADITEAMTVIELSGGISARAQDLQERLTHRGWHRAPGPVDLLLAATAIEHELTLLHLDEDFELIARASSLQQERVVPRDAPAA